MERFTLPEALAGDRSVRSEIRQLLADAEEAQKSLWLACRSFARNLLGRGDREPDKEDIRKFTYQMPINAWYWSALESRFHEILREYTLDRDLDDIRYTWLTSVRTTLSKAWAKHSASVATGDAWAMRALVKAESLVFGKLNELQAEIRKLEPERTDKEIP